MGLFPAGTLFVVIYHSGSIISRTIINNSIILSFLKNLVQPISTLHTEVLVGEVIMNLEVVEEVLRSLIYLKRKRKNCPTRFLHKKKNKQISKNT